MKSIKSVILFVFASGLLQAQDVTVKGTTKLNTDFSKYRTYGWAKSDATIPTDVYEIYTCQEQANVTQKTTSKQNRKGYIYSYTVTIPASNPVINASVQNSIAEELEGRAFNPATAPDLFVVYRVLDKSATFKGYKNGTSTMVWGTEVRQPADTAIYVLAPGTLLISLVDAKTSEVVWDGFASGLFQQGSFVSDEIKLKESIHRIFNELKYGEEISKVEN